MDHTWPPPGVMNLFIVGCTMETVELEVQALLLKTKGFAHNNILHSAVGAERATRVPLCV